MLLFVAHGIAGDDDDDDNDDNDDDADDDNDESCCSECKYGTGERKLLMDSWKLACACKLCHTHTRLRHTQI
jgi:hypothetical protein